MDEPLYQIRSRSQAAARPAESPWRSLRELEATRAPGPRSEFPPGAVPAGAIDRRGFMQLAGAALAASAGCTVETPHKILPYTRPPADVVPGVPAFYATSMVLDGYASGLIVESHEGRPTKIEANPEHPASLGGTTMLEQASVRQLYDDWRARGVRFDGEQSSWDDLFAALRAGRTDHGAGLRILMEPTTSPVLLALIERVRRRFPEARAAFHASIRQESGVAGGALAFGRALQPQYDFSRADVVVSLDADFLFDGPFSTRYARQWADRRRLPSAASEPNRLYLVESQLSVTGSMADNRLRRRLSHVPEVAVALARALGVSGGPHVGAATMGDADVAAFVRAVARDLQARPRGRTLILAGDRQPPAVHALAYAMNDALGNLGGPVTFTAPILPQPGGALLGFDELVTEMRGGRVDTLLVLDVNPVYTAPADLGFREALARVQDAICLAYYEHETAERCRWFAPAAHYLETWGDARAYDGTISMQQPLIEPLVGARAPVEVLAALAGDPAPDARRLVHDHWTQERGLGETDWQRALQRGFQPGTAEATVEARVDRAAIAQAAASLSPAGAAGGALEIELYPSPTVYDGRFANNPWLLEQPTPIGKLTWDNAALVSPETARRFGLADEKIVTLHVPHAEVWAPVLIVPGMADGVAALWLGYGRRGQEAVAAGVGFNAYPLRTRAHRHVVPDVRVTVAPDKYELALTQEHWYTHDRPIALRATLADYRRDPAFTAPYRGAVYSMLPDYQYTGNQWAMSIDLGICTGCSACTVACQAENNLQIVGKAQVRNSREMNWLRIDTYFFGEPEAPRLVHQPMMCQHCEKAPCEYVCPVEATVHSPDGLNEMVYNRCVGTRFCSNNCPYKVRRFNWFDWGEQEAMNRGLSELQYNPEVTVRERGVMEKCTYCVQRIRRAEIAAELDNRQLRPGEVVTACQAACPTGAIQFGSLAHRDTEMVRRREQDRAYAVLQQEEGTHPRTVYLARIDDPNPELG